MTVPINTSVRKTKYWYLEDAIEIAQELIKTHYSFEVCPLKLNNKILNSNVNLQVQA